MASVKIILIKNNSNKAIYTDLPKSYRDLLIFLQDNVQVDLDYFVYWIDAENDKIEINNEYSFNMFRRLSPNQTTYEKKIYVEIGKKLVRENVNTEGNSADKIQKDKQEKTEKSHKEKREEKKRSATKDENRCNTVHFGVQCDGCDTIPIVGNRYKCLQCVDYDLCANCERQNVHNTHKMIRLPEKLSRRENRMAFGIGCPFTGDFPAMGDPQTNNEPLFSGGRRHGHHRHRRCHREPSNIWSSIIQMMSGLAEGGNVNPNEQNKPEEKMENSSDNKNNNSNDDNNEQSNNNNNNNNNNNGNEGPRKPGFFYDQEAINAGVEILTNFSQMFSKIIDPVNVTVEVDVDGLKTNFNNRNSRNNSVPTENKEQQENKESTPAESTENVETKSNENMNMEETTEPQNEENIAEDVNMLNEEGAVGFSQNQNNSENPNIRKSTSQEDAEWTIIDDSMDSNKSLKSNKTQESMSSASNSILFPTPTAPSQTETSSEINFSQLSKDLENHVLEEKAKEEQKKEAERNKEIKVDVVYHRKPHINNAVIAMKAMGFSNEGDWLTHLLESVDGDISQALDLLKPVK